VILHRLSRVLTAKWVATMVTLVRRELDQVHRQAERLANQRAAFRAAVLAARDAGASYRQIARATGGRLSHTGIQKIVRAAK